MGYTSSMTDINETIKHLKFPRLRPVEAFLVEHEGAEYIGLRDLSNLSESMCAMSRQAVSICEMFTGEKSVEEIAGIAAVDIELLKKLVEQLDKAILLEGATFEDFRNRLLADFDSSKRVEIRSAVESSPEAMDEVLAEVRDSKDYQLLSKCDAGGEGSEVHGLVVPHIDFTRGRVNYAVGYAAVNNPVNDYDRVIVFGTNHYGTGTGVVMCPMGYETLAGPLECDKDLLSGLVDILGDSLIKHRLDNIREHSVELQMPWIRHVLGEVPVAGFLVHDPTFRNGASYDGQGVGLDEFVKSLNELLVKLGGRTLFVCGADLSHIGQQFGDSELIDQARLLHVEEFDRQHLQYLLDGELVRFLKSITVKGNPSRWCTVGGLAALWRMLPDCKAQLLRYDQAVDNPDGGVCCVSSAAIVLR